METQHYANYNNDGEDQDYQKPARKKKHHRKPKEEIVNDDDMYNDYNGPTMAYEVQQPNPIKSEEENFDPTQAPRKKHRSKAKKREEEYVEEPEPRYNDEEYREETMYSPEPVFEAEQVARKPKKERKKKNRDHVDEEGENQYLNINLHSPNGNDHNYPFEDVSESLQMEDEEVAPSEGDASTKNETPEPSAKPKKKSGGFMKIFSSFKKKKNKKGESSLNGNQWQSNPEIFNPAYDSHDGTMEKTSKKIRGKSSRDLATNKTHVILLDGMEVDFDADQKMLGKDLFDNVCVYLDLIEKDFFGMTYVNTKLQTWFWLEMDKKISKQLTSSDEWVFNFQVKFYPPEPVLLQEDITRYLLSLQVRQDVYTGKLPCSWITQALLGSFMVQSELGDYDELEHGDGIEYLREFEFVLNQSDQLLEKIFELHKKHISMSPDKADIKYLETAKRLEQYGVDLHPARDNDDVEILIGVCYQGVLIYRDRLRIGRFAWPKVLRISYKKNYFYLKIRSDRYDDSIAIVGFKLFNHNLAKRLWKNAVEQHTFFRMKEPQNQKQTARILPNSSSTYGYTGKTLHQYRSMNISQNRAEPLKFDRSTVKRRTIGSMPAGLERAGMQYNSMHSLNRAHPRDMTLGKTKSIEYLSGKRPGSSIGIIPNREGSISNMSNRQMPQSKYPQYLGVKDDDRHMSFQSGDSLNAADSYVARYDDQASLPPMPSKPQPEYARPYKKKGSKNTPSNDILSDDGIGSEEVYARPFKKQNSKANRLNEDLSDEDVNPQPQITKPAKKHSRSRPTDVLSDDGVNARIDYGKPLKKKNSRTDPPAVIPSDEEISPPLEVIKPHKKHSRSRSNDVLSDDGQNSQPDYSKPLKKHNSKIIPPREDLSDEATSPQPEYTKPHKKHSRRRSNDVLSNDGVVSPTPQGRLKLGLKVEAPEPMFLPDPPVETSYSEDVDSYVKPHRKRSSHKPADNNGIVNQSRPQPPNQFRPPPPPPEPIPQPRSNSDSERSSPMEHHLPPPPPPIIDISIAESTKRPKPPPVKPKPAVKPKPKPKDQPVVTKPRYDDASSNDDML